MRARSIYAIILTAILSNIAIATELSGTITDSQTRAVLPGAHISIAGTKIGAATDSEGRFTIKNLPSGDYEINIHLIGYKKASKKITLKDSVENAINVALDETPWELDKVVVTATRTPHLLKDVPVTTEVITKEDMAATGALTVDQALDSHVGVTIDDDLSGKGATIRGVDPSRVLILIDGHRVVGQVRGSIDLAQISLSDIDRIEIVKGSGSTLYGSDALGGVINIITKKPTASRSLESSIEYGSFATFDPEFSLEIKKPKLGWLFSGKHEETSGFDLDKSTPMTNGLEAIKRYNLNSKISYSPKESFYSELELGYMHERKQWVESEYFEPLQKTFAYDDYEWNNRYDISTTHRYMASPKTNFEASLHGSYYNHDWSKYTRAVVKQDSSITTDYIMDGSLQANHTISSKLIVTSGTDFSTAGLKSSQIIDGNKKVSFGDIYLQAEYIPLKDFTVLPGIRWERHQTYGNHYNPSLNLKWSPSERLTFRGSASRGFRAPSIKELYFIFDHSAAGYIVYGGGSELNPEKSSDYSFTVETNYGRRGLHRLTFFRNDLSNLIDFNLVEFTPAYWRGVYKYQNIVKARTQGLEWESKVKVCTGWDFSFSYMYLLAKDLTDHTDLINRPQHTAKFTNSFYVPRWDAGMTFWGTYHDHKLWTSAGDTPDRISKVYAPKLITLNLNLYKRFFKTFETYFRVENLTNSINATYGYWPPRSYTVGMRFNFFNGADNGQSNRID
jgi:outer membrane receptor for ferrienterochelin and colicins